MARVLVAAQIAPGAYPVVTANSRDLAMQAADPSLKNYALIVDNKTVLIVENTHATDPQTVTIASVADSPFNRTGDVTAYSLSAGEIAWFGPFKEAGWKTPTGGGTPAGLWFEGSDATVKFAVITLT